MKIGVLGGTGPAGQGVAARLARWATTWCSVRATRNAPPSIVGELRARWGDQLNTLVPGTNREAGEAEVVVVATVADAAIETAR